MCTQTTETRGMKHFWVTSIPRKSRRCPNSIYFLKSGDNPVEMFVTSSTLELYPISSSTLGGIRIISGIDNPNITPPEIYSIADFYIQKNLQGQPIKLWQYNGIQWIGQGEYTLEWEIDNWD